MAVAPGYRNLEVWQKAVELVATCYRLTDLFPRSEEFGLRSQIRRSATSIPANIAEGQGRLTTGDYIHHLSIAHGSLMELETHVQVSEKLGYTNRSQVNEVLVQTEEIGRMINGLVRRLRERRSRTT